MTDFVPEFELYDVPDVDTNSGAKIGDLTGQWFPMSFSMSINRWGVGTGEAKFYQSRFRQFGEIQRGREIRAWYNKTEGVLWGKWWIKSVSSRMGAREFTAQLIGASSFYQSATPSDSAEITNPTYRNVAEQLAVLCDRPLPFGTWTNTAFDSEPFLIMGSANMLDVLKVLTMMDCAGIDSLNGGFMSTADCYFMDPNGNGTTLDSHELFQASVGNTPWVTYTIGDDVEMADYSESDDDSYTHLRVIGHARRSEEDRRVWVFPSVTYPYETGITSCVIPTGATRTYTYDAKGITSLVSAAALWAKWQRIFIPLRPVCTIHVANLDSTMPLPARGVITVKDEYGETILSQTPERVSIQFVDQSERKPRCAYEIGKPEIDWDTVIAQWESRILSSQTGVPHPQVSEGTYKITARTGNNSVVTYSYDGTTPTYNYLYSLTIANPMEVEAGYLSATLVNRQVKGKAAFNVGDYVNVVTLFDDTGVFDEQYIEPSATIDLNNLATDGSNTRALSDALGFKADNTLAPKAT